MSRKGSGLRRIATFLGLGALMGSVAPSAHEPIPHVDKPYQPTPGPKVRRQKNKKDHESLKARKRKRTIVKMSRRANRPVHKKKKSYRQKKEA